MARSQKKPAAVSFQYKHIVLVLKSNIYKKAGSSKMSLRTRTTTIPGLFQKQKSKQI